MTKLRCHISISLDGFVAGPNQSEKNPLGGPSLHHHRLTRVMSDNEHGVVVRRIVAPTSLRDAEVQLEQVRAVEGPGVAHLKYRSVKFRRGSAGAGVAHQAGTVSVKVLCDQTCSYVEIAIVFNALPTPKRERIFTRLAR